MEDGREWEGKENEEGPKRERRSSSEGGRKTYLDDLVPSGGDDDGVQGVGGESNAGDPGRRRKRSEHGEGGKGGDETRRTRCSPLGVSLILDVELALSKGVPELDGSVSGSRDNLSVVGGEGDAGGEEGRRGEGGQFLLLVLLLRLSSSLRSFSYE